MIQFLGHPYHPWWSRSGCVNESSFLVVKRTLFKMGKITSSTINPPTLVDSLEARRGGGIWEDGLPSLRGLPTDSDGILNEPSGSTFFTGRMVPIQRSAGVNTVSASSTDVGAAYDARVERTDPEPKISLRGYDRTFEKGSQYLIQFHLSCRQDQESWESLW